MTPEKPVRVRFAPSPTGCLHVGGARTAIFNDLFARNQGGVLVLRIEDTDLERSTRESEESLINELKWLGIEWGEGPDVGGEFGPYRQSERGALYRKTADEFVKKGLAYPCFCDEASLQAKREQAAKESRPPGYDGTCRDLSAEDIAANREKKVSEAIRFRVPEETIRFTDDVRGEIELETKMVGDFVIVRSNGQPTYNFAVTLDDHGMKITHVLRGEEHLSNTLRQILVYRAIGGDVPRFAHLPLILAEDRSKLSKRHGGSSVGELREMGFLPDAVVNYLVLLGWSHPEGKEILGREELVRSFSVDRINRSAAVYDKKKLRWMNGQYIRAADPDALFPKADRYFPEDVQEHYNEPARRRIWGILQDSVETLANLATAASIFRSLPELNDEAREFVTTDESQTVLAEFEKVLQSEKGPLTVDGFKASLKDVGKATGIKGKQLFFPVRGALTGSVHGPDLAGVAAIKGRTKVLELIARARTLGPGS